MSKRGLSAALIALLVPMMGASCPHVAKHYQVTTMRVLPESPSLVQVVEAVNSNTAKIQSLLTTDATLSGPDFPTLRANIAFAPPRQFRLRAETALSGPELDMGSNQDHFWFWVRRNTPAAVYYCSHVEFPQSQSRHVLPVDPQWIIEALGVTHLEPTASHEGPIPSTLGETKTLTLKTPRHSPQGILTQVTVVDEATAWILEQQLWDAQGQLLARAVAREHQEDPQSGVTLPREVEIEWPPAKFAMTIRIKHLRINELGDDQPQLWTRPVIAGVQEYNLAVTPPPVPAP
jgi:hypothetical protein